MRTRFPLARFYGAACRTLNFHSVHDIQPASLPLCRWQAIERAQKMFLELSRPLRWLRSSINPKNIPGPIRIDLYSREHDLNPKNILGAIRFLRHCRTARRKQKNVRGPKQDRWMRAARKMF